MTLEVYIDGACSGNGSSNSVAGIGIHFPNGEYSDVSEKCPSTYGNVTNNIAELYVLKRTLEITQSENGPISIYSDSSYVIGIFTGWLKNWIKKGIVSEKCNSQLILEIAAILRDNVTLIKVKGHSSSIGNNKADKLAVLGKSL